MKKREEDQKFTWKKKKNQKGEKKLVGCCFSNQIFDFRYAFLISFHLLLQGNHALNHCSKIPCIDLYFFFFKLQYISWLFWTLEGFVYIYIYIIDRHRQRQASILMHKKNRVKKPPNIQGVYKAGLDLNKK